MTGETITGSGTRGSGWVVGCAIGGLGLAGLCLVPTGAYWLFATVDRGGSSTIGSPYIPIDPGVSGTGGPHMPMSVEDMRAEPREDRKVFDLEVVSLRGGRWARAGDYCRIDVLFDPMRTELACRAAVTCGETPVYGGAELGYYECDRSPYAYDLRVGIDANPTSFSNDAMIEVSLAEVRISDTVGSSLGDFELVLSRSRPGPGPPADTVWVEPVFVPEGSPIPGPLLDPLPLPPG